MIEHLTILLMTQQSPLTFSVGLTLGVLFGGIVGAVFAGLMKYAMERKNKLILAYSQLTGEKFLMVQVYENFISLLLSVQYSRGLQMEYAKQGKKDQAKNVENENEYNIKKCEEEGENLVKVQTKIWKTIGLINAITNNKKVYDLIEDIRKEEISINDFREEIANETKEGLPNYTRDGSDFSELKWLKPNNDKLDSHIKYFEKRLDILIDYVRKNETVKHWWRFIEIY